MKYLHNESKFFPTLQFPAWKICDIYLKLLKLLLWYPRRALSSQLLCLQNLTRVLAITAYSQIRGLCMLPCRSSTWGCSWTPHQEDLLQSPFPWPSIRTLPWEMLHEMGITSIGDCDTSFYGLYKNTFMPYLSMSNIYLPLNSSKFSWACLHYQFGYFTERQVTSRENLNTYIKISSVFHGTP